MFSHPVCCVRTVTISSIVRMSLLRIKCAIVHHSTSTVLWTHYPCSPGAPVWHLIWNLLAIHVSWHSHTSVFQQEGVLWGCYHEACSPSLSAQGCFDSNGWLVTLLSSNHLRLVLSPCVCLCQHRTSTHLETLGQGNINDEWTFGS